MDIIKPLVDAWASHPAILQQLRTHITVFTPGTAPDFVKWTSYPVNIALKSLYTKFKHTTQSPASTEGTKVEDVELHIWTEVASLLERTTAYAYTGSNRVFPVAIGKIFWVASTVLTGGLPCFNPNIVAFKFDPSGTIQLAITAEAWPKQAGSDHPLRSSERCQEMEYKDGFQHVSLLTNTSNWK